LIWRRQRFAVLGGLSRFGKQHILTMNEYRILQFYLNLYAQ